MIKFSIWMENLQTANSGNMEAQKQLGSANLAARQDIVDAIDLVAKDPSNSSALNSIFNNLSRLVAKQDAGLASRLGTSARKFVNASKHAGTHQPLGDVSTDANQNNTNNQPIRSAQ